METHIVCFLSGKLIASASAGGTVQVLKARVRGNSAACMMTSAYHTDSVDEVAWSPDGKWITPAGDQPVQVWEAEGW